MTEDPTIIGRNRSQNRHVGNGCQGGGVQTPGVQLSLDNYSQQILQQMKMKPFTTALYMDFSQVQPKKNMYSSFTTGPNHG